jgi:hypothetical protein
MPQSHTEGSDNVAKGCFALPLATSEFGHKRPVDAYGIA